MKIYPGYCGLASLSAVVQCQTARQQKQKLQERKRMKKEDELRPTIRSLKYADVIRETTRIVVIAKIPSSPDPLQHVYRPAPGETMDAPYDRVLSYWTDENGE
jgi:hypothetical protein